MTLVFYYTPRHVRPEGGDVKVEKLNSQDAEFLFNT